jgi:pectinesterase
MGMSPRLGPAAVFLLAAGPLLAAEAPVRVVVTNGLGRSRAAETVSVPAGTAAGLRPADLPKVAVVDAASGKTVLSQAVDSDGDGSPDLLVFQADFGASETREFLLKPGERPPYRKEDFRVYGRFARERYDDFAWENDRVAHRMYGEALETWQAEPLTSSTVDVWCKRTARLVVNDWYMVDDYHRDTGEGADLYSAGKSRGAGGSGVWRDGRLFVSKNFRRSRVLAAGPIRLVFELTYEAWDAGGVKVSEKKRVTLDAGSRFNRFESLYAAEGGTPVAHVAGLKKAAASYVRVERPAGTIRTWEALKEGNGNLGLALLVEPDSLSEVVEVDGNVLAVGKPSASKTAVHWAGSAWDKDGDVKSVGEWDRAISEFAERVRSPLKVEVRNQ